MGSQGELAALFHNGSANIETKRTADLFKELDGRDLTANEQSIIAQRVAHQRRMLKAYEEMDQTRKENELMQVCECLTREEAAYVLKEYNGREDDGAAALINSASYLRKVKLAVSGPEAVLALAPPRTAQANTHQATAPAAPKRPPATVIDSTGTVFVGAFRGKIMPGLPAPVKRSSPDRSCSPEVIQLRPPVPTPGLRGRRRPRTKADPTKWVAIFERLLQPMAMVSGDGHTDEQHSQAATSDVKGIACLQGSAPGGLDALIQAAYEAHANTDLAGGGPGGAKTDTGPQDEHNPNASRSAEQAPHAKSQPRSAAVPALKPRLGRVKRCSSKRVELVCAGSLRLEKGWHNSGYIFPDGFKSKTVFRSSVDPNQLCVHHCEINGEGGRYWPAPTFRVAATDRPHEPLEAKSATGCWNAVLTRINNEINRRRAEGEDWPPPPKTAIAGPEYFGLSNPTIVSELEQLDSEHSCTIYWCGKEDRQAFSNLAEGEVPMRPLRPAAPEPAPPPPQATTSRPVYKRSRRRDEEDDLEANIVHNRWSSVGRAERYKKRYGLEASKGAEQDNPLPDLMDPITLERVVNPAISPFGHVMGHATWMAVLAEQGKCPFTQKPLRRDQVTIITRANVEKYREQIVSL